MARQIYNITWLTCGEGEGWYTVILKSFFERLKRDEEKRFCFILWRVPNSCLNSSLLEFSPSSVEVNDAYLCIWKISKTKVQFLKSEKVTPFEIWRNKGGRGECLYLHLQQFEVLLEGDGGMTYFVCTCTRTFHLNYQLILLQKRREYGVMYMVRTIGFSDLDFFWKT